MGKKPICAAVVALFLLVGAGSALAQNTPDNVPTAPAIQIGAGDMIDITVFGQSDLSGHLRVNEKGDVLVPLLGMVHVAGMTADDSAVDINERYIKAQILNAGQQHVAILISEYASQGILVTGEVRSPGLYPALGVRMLNDVLLAAGGVTQTASSRITITHKNLPQSPNVVEYKPDLTPQVIPQVQIMPGDTISVPRAGLVYVAGNVTRPGAYVLDGQRTLTIEKLFALTGWGGAASSLDHTHLVRTQSDGNREDIELSVTRIFKGKAPDIVLRDGDILWIPTSRAKMITSQAISSALGIGTSIAIYRTQTGTF